MDGCMASWDCWLVGRRRLACCVLLVLLEWMGWRWLVLRERLVNE